MIPEPDWKAGLDEEIMAFVGFVVGMMFFPISWFAFSFWHAFGTLSTFVVAGAITGFLIRKADKR